MSPLSWKMVWMDPRITTVNQMMMTVARMVLMAGATAPLALAG
jgi:hypothetical protein